MGVALVLGHPVAHSLSPAMHNAAFRALGLPHRYEAQDVAPDELPAAVVRLRALHELVGANVTVPHKEAIGRLLDGVTPEARAIGAVNTIVRSGSRLEGHNTDRIGFAAALVERDVAVAGRRVLVLGAGGAARAAVLALLAGGATVVVANRTAARAAQLTAALGGAPIAWPKADRHALAGIDILVNATSAGLQGEDPLPGVALPAGLTVFDLIPTARLTPLLIRSAAAGCRTVDGLLMLLHQAAASFALWTGDNAPVPAMRAALPRRV